MINERHRTAPNPHEIGFDDEIPNRDRMKDFTDMRWRGHNMPCEYRMATLAGANDTSPKYYALNDDEAARVRNVSLNVLSCSSREDETITGFVGPGDKKAVGFILEKFTEKGNPITIKQGNRR